MNKKIIIVSAICLAFLISLYISVKAQSVDRILGACALEQGIMHLIDTTSSEQKCRDAGGQYVLWNSQGLKGDKGDKGASGIRGPKGDTGPVGPKGDTGPIGPQGTHGAGNISFTTRYAGNIYILKDDGTVWQNELGVWKKLIGNQNVLPIPASKIVTWENYEFVDTDGNFWEYYGNEWINRGHP